ncbi:MAG: EAL domain-containing protein, partial [Gammaproteobacteria bacterium]
INVVAEGVETGEQLAYLTQRQCDQVQGYYLGRPIPVEEFHRRIQQEKLAGGHLSREMEM